MTCSSRPSFFTSLCLETIPSTLSATDHYPFYKHDRTTSTALTVSIAFLTPVLISSIGIPFTKSAYTTNIKTSFPWPSIFSSLIQWVPHLCTSNETLSTIAFYIRILVLLMIHVFHCNPRSYLIGIQSCAILRNNSLIVWKSLCRHQDFI